MFVTSERLRRLYRFHLPLSPRNRLCAGQAACRGRRFRRLAVMSGSRLFSGSGSGRPAELRWDGRINYQSGERMFFRRSIWVLIAASSAGCGWDAGDAPADQPAGQAAQPAGPGEWQVLFDGSSLGGWRMVGDANWAIDGDTVRADQSTEAGFLVTAESYADFELSLEFWVDVPANSGVFLRCQDEANFAAETCYEINIFDTRPDPTYRTGSVVNHQAPAEAVNTGGRWNSYEILADGARLQATLNGVEMFDFTDDNYASGPIALQYGSGTVIFRNIRVRRR